MLVAHTGDRAARRDDIVDERIDELRGACGWRERQRIGDVLGHDPACLFGARAVDLDLHVEPAGAQHRRVDHVDAVRGADHDHVVKLLHAVEFRKELRHDRRLHVRGDTGTAGAQQRVHLVDEHDHRASIARPLARAVEDEADQPFGFAHVFVEQFRAFDRKEHTTAAGALSQRVRHGLRDQCLAVAGRTVQQHAFRRFQRETREQVAVRERQFHRVFDRGDLLVEPADVVEGDVRRLFKHEAVGVFAWQHLHRESR